MSLGTVPSRGPRLTPKLPPTGTNDAKSRDAGGPQYWKDDCGDPPFDLERCSFARAYASLLKVNRRVGKHRLRAALGG